MKDKLSKSNQAKVQYTLRERHLALITFSKTSFYGALI